MKADRGGSTNEGSDAEMLLPEMKRLPVSENSCDNDGEGMERNGDQTIIFASVESFNFCLYYSCKQTEPCKLESTNRGVMPRGPSVPSSVCVGLLVKKSRLWWQIVLFH